MITEPRSSGIIIKIALPVVLLLLLASCLLNTGSSGFRVRETASSDVCQTSSGQRCTSPASSSTSSTPWSSAGLRSRRGFETVSTRGGFVKPPVVEKDDDDEENVSDDNNDADDKGGKEEKIVLKWKDKKARTWTRLGKLKDDGKKVDSDEDEARVDSDDELVQIEDEDEDDDDEVIVEDSDDESKEKLEREEERKRKEEDERRRREKDEEDKRKKEEEEKKRREKEIEEQRKRKEEEERKKREKDLEEKRKREEAERRKKEEIERKLKEEAERKLKEAAERQRKEEEERKSKEEEERRKKEEEERQRKIEEERRRKEEERKRKEEEERKRREEERRRKEEEERRRKEEERRRKEEEDRRRKHEEEERLKKEEEEKRLKEEEEQRRLKEEEECRLAEEEEKRVKELEEKRLKEEEERKKREAEVREAERKRKIEEDKKRKELEAEKKRKKKEEEERLRKEKEEKQAERLRDAEEDRKRMERVKREAEEKRLRDEEERKMKVKAKVKKVKVEDDDDDDDEDDNGDDGDDDKAVKIKKNIEKIRMADKEKKSVVQEVKVQGSKATAKTKAAEVTKTKTDKTVKQSTSKKLTTAAASGEKKTVSKPQGGTEAMLSLAELNDLILSVPTFVPNFTAIEDSACQQHGKIFLRQLRGYKLWALQMLDSGAKIPAGLLRGNVNQLGDFDQCLGVAARVKLDSRTIRIQGKYCLANVDLYAIRPATKVPVNLMQSRALVRGSIRDPGHFVPKFTTANWAICLPATCTAEDARRSIENALDSYNTTLGIKFVVEVDPDMCYVKPKSQSYSKETIGVLYFYAIFVCIAIVATLRDYLGKAQEKGNYSERIIMSFSLKRTLKSLFGYKETTSSSDIGCIHGIRALSSIALYVAHKLIPTSRIPYANRVSLTEVASHPLSLILRASLFYTDSFLLMSGVLTAFNMAKELSTRGEIRWFSRLIARYIRLTPPLLAIIFWYAFVMEHTGSGPQWNAVIKSNADICKENAWTNLFYVQNFFPFEDMCAAHTHQLALDMQLTLAAPALVFFLQIKPVVGIIVVFFLLQVSATLRYLATSNNNLSLVIFHGMTIKHLYKTANLTYILPLHRATPYLFGVSLGVLLHHTGKNARINKIFATIGWILSIALGAWSIFSPWRLARRDYVYNVEEATHYAVVSPILTALSLSWTIFACFTNNGGFVNRILSNYWMVVLSKLSYTIYLSQFIIFFYNVGTARYSSEFHPFRALDPLEVASVVIVSIVLTLLFDIPMQEMKSIIMECSDVATSEKSKEPVEANQANNNNNVKKIPQEESFEDEEDENEPGNWNWERGTFTRFGRSETRDESDDQQPVLRSSRIKRQDIRRQSIIIPDGYDDWDSSRRTSRSEEPIGTEGDRWSSRSDYRLSGAGLEEELAAANYLRGQRDQVYQRAYSKSPMRDLDAPVIRRSMSRERHVSAEPDLPPHRDYSNKPLITISQEDDYQPNRSPRSSISRFGEPQRSLSSESELEPLSRRSSASYGRRSSTEPRVVDDDEWEEDVRLRRGRFFQDHRIPGSQEREHVTPAIVEEEADDEWDSLKRRSSAEGKMALLKEPIRPGNIALWTVSKIQLGSSQEPDDEDFDDDGTYKRPEYREQGPPLREVFESDEQNKESRRKSFGGGGSLPTSFEDEEDSAAYDFSLSNDSKRITVQDLSRLSSEEDTPFQSQVNQLDVKPGLIKRESIIKSQASEEDPEYLLPERPKLVEQEQEHPFKKAWQMQKSRSEEEGAGFVVKELRSASTSLEKQDEEPEEDKRDNETKREGAQSQKIGPDDVSCDVTLVWQTRGAESNGGYDKSKSSSLSSGIEQSKEEEEDQIDGYRGRRKSDEEKCTWTDKDT